MPDKIKILIIEDHLIVRNGIRLMLEHLMHFGVTIFEAENGKKGIDLYKKMKPDIVLLDIQMPVMDGFETLVELKKIDPNVKIIVLTSFGDNYNIKQMLESGAKSFLLKNVGAEEFSKAIQTVYSGEKYFCNEVTQILLANTLVEKNTALSQYRLPIDIEKILSAKEKEIVFCILDENSNQEMAERFSLSLRTIEGHKNRICKKLGVKGTSGILSYLYNKGIIKN